MIHLWWCFFCLDGNMKIKNCNDCWWNKSCTTWDVKKTCKKWDKTTYQLVQDFFHQRYVVEQKNCENVYPVKIWGNPFEPLACAWIFVILFFLAQNHTTNEPVGSWGIWGNHFQVPNLIGNTNDLEGTERNRSMKLTSTNANINWAPPSIVSLSYPVWDLLDT